MDYLEIAEKIFKYFDFNMSERSLELLFEIKKKLNFDSALFASLVNDYLLLNNKFNDLSQDVFSDFLLFIDNKNKIEILEELNYFAGIYRTIVFEKTDDNVALWAISTVNSCYKIEFYPILMYILHLYYNHKIDSQEYNIMLQSLVDITIKCFANPDIKLSLKEVSQTTIKSNIFTTRCAG